MRRSTFQRNCLFITGTDTGVGKTVLTVLLAEYLRQGGVGVAALKPICSGGRGDARGLHRALAGALTLDQINPWHFRAPVAPLLAARRQGVAITLAEVLPHLRAMQAQFEITLVEGAGGLLSPLGEDFDSRDLIVGLAAVPVIVAPNKLGTVNHILLTLEALPARFRRRAKIVLMSLPKPDAASATNAALLKAVGVRLEIHLLPWLSSTAGHAKGPNLRRTLAALVET